MGEKGGGKSNSIKKFFETMEYGKEKESTEKAIQWLKSKEKVFAYIDKVNEPRGEPTVLKNAINEEKLCDVYVPDAATVDAILKNATDSKNTWIEVPPVKRATILNKLASEVQKRNEIFIQLEILTRGILSKDTKTKALPLLTDYLEYYSSFCVKPETGNPGTSLSIIGNDNTLAIFGLILGSCLASGNKVILQTSIELSPVAQLLIEIATEVGIPEGLIRLIPGFVDPSTFFVNAGLSTILIFDDIYKEQYLIANNLNKKCLHYGSSGSSMIVFDNCDLDSACHTVIEAAWGHKGTLPHSVRKIFVQENVFEKFTHKLTQTINQKKIGSSDEKNVDLGRLDKISLQNLDNFVQKAKTEGVDIYQQNKSFPVICIGGSLSPNNVIKEDLTVPVVSILAFRSINEVTNLCNNTRQGFGVSVWSESTSLVHEIVGKLKAGNIWINSFGLFGACVTTSPYKSSGNGFFGGNDGFLEHTATKSLQNEAPYEKNTGEMMEKAINEAKKADWLKFTNSERRKYLQTLVQSVQENQNLWSSMEKWVSDWINLIYEYITNNFGECFINYKNYNVVVMREPCGVVAIETTDNKDTHNKKIIISALFEGNSVIILNECDSVNSFYLFMAKVLPKGVLTVVQQSQDAIKVAALHKELNVYIGERKNKIFSSLPLKTSNKFKTANLDNWQEVRNKISLVKNVWFNKGQTFV